MKKLTVAAYGLLIIATLMSLTSCKKSDTTTGPGGGAITDLLFPLTVGNKITYNGWLTDTLGNKIAGSDAGFASSITVTPATGTAATLGATVVAMDTVKAGGQTTVTPLMMRMNGNDLQLIQSIGSFYLSFGKTGMAVTDTLRWFDFVKASAGLGVNFRAFEDSILVPGTSLWAHLIVTGVIDKREDKILNGTTFSQTYHVVLSTQAKLGLQTVSSMTAFILNLAVGVGPVVIQVPYAGATSPGVYRQFLSKNFQ